MKQILFTVIVSSLCVASVWAQKSVRTEGSITKQATISKRENSNLLSEEFSFLIENFKMNNQSEVNNLNIKVRVRYENGISENKYPDFRAILEVFDRLLFENFGIKLSAAERLWFALDGKELRGSVEQERRRWTAMVQTVAHAGSQTVAHGYYAGDKSRTERGLKL